MNVWNVNVPFQEEKVADTGGMVRVLKCNHCSFRGQSYCGMPTTEALLEMALHLITRNPTGCTFR